MKYFIGKMKHFQPAALFSLKELKSSYPASRKQCRYLKNISTLNYCMESDLTVNMSPKSTLGILNFSCRKCCQFIFF